jgi:predicted nucleic acid-binding protein
MRQVFADTVYWTALFSWRDDLHQKAIKLSRSLEDTQIVTNDLVLIEFLNAIASRGPRSRSMGSSSVELLLSNPEIVVEALTPELFTAALKLHTERPDKSWSLTDCASFLTMRRFNIDSALTFDNHFEQAGFTALLR